MSRLIESLNTLGISSQLTMAGRWATFEGERSLVHVLVAPWSAGFFGWCDAPDERGVRRYADPVTAIHDGLRRATKHTGASAPGDEERSRA